MGAMDRYVKKHLDEFQADFLKKQEILMEEQKKKFWSQMDQYRAVVEEIARDAVKEEFDKRSKLEIENKNV